MDIYVDYLLVNHNTTHGAYKNGRLPLFVGLFVGVFNVAISASNGKMVMNNEVG
jgi:hypothetical protein